MRVRKTLASERPIRFDASCKERAAQRDVDILPTSDIEHIAMGHPAELRARARYLYGLARATANGDESLLHMLHAIECEQQAEDVERRCPGAGLSVAARRDNAGSPGHLTATLP
jgi:hypothetical protein